MFRMIVSWGVALAVVFGAGLSFGQVKVVIDPYKAAEDVLTAKELHPSAAMYISRGEDEVKKASDAAEARLKEYRHAAAQERAALQDIIDKKAMAKELTKERDELKKEMDQALPAIRAQVQRSNSSSSLTACSQTRCAAAVAAMAGSSPARSTPRSTSWACRSTCSTLRPASTP